VALIFEAMQGILWGCKGFGFEDSGDESYFPQGILDASHLELSVAARDRLLKRWAERAAGMPPIQEASKGLLAELCCRYVHEKDDIAASEQDPEPAERSDIPATPGNNAAKSKVVKGSAALACGKFAAVSNLSVKHLAKEWQSYLSEEEADIDGSGARRKARVMFL